MQFINRLYSILIITVVSLGCSQKNTIESCDYITLDYSSDNLWFELSTDTNKEVDIFYILPTCIWDWTNDQGEICHYADIDNSEQREAMQGSYELARDIFAGDNYNFFAPYYRQISLESWIEGDSVVSARFPNAMKDIKSAFDEFIENRNNNRPFIIAGYSQGGKGVVELLKTMNQDEYSRMIAAYVIGYRITESEIDEYSNIKMATDSIESGVAICYNSVESIEAICPLFFPSKACINPVSWSISEEAAILNDSVTVSVDSNNGVLIVEGLDSSQYYLSILGDLLVEGNYHLQELTLYQQKLHENVIQRVENYTKYR